jgi:hypothetical protein
MENLIMSSMRQLYLPYMIKAVYFKDRHIGYVFLNRYYKPCGSKYISHVPEEEYADLLISSTIDVKISEEMAEKLAYKGVYYKEKGIVQWFYLYDSDGPDDDYYVRLQLLNSINT